MPTNRQRIYLAYGSNLHPRRLEARVGAVRLLGTVELPGWALNFDKRGGDGSAKANLHAAPGTGRKALAAAFAIDPDQLGKLDVFEGCGHGYETVPMTVRIDRREVEAFTYLVPSQWISSRMRPFDWYLDLIVSGARHHGFDEEFVQSIASRSAWIDPDRARARRELEAMNLPLPEHYES
jgi:hypothetical protein